MNVVFLAVGVATLLYDRVPHIPAWLICMADLLNDSNATKLLDVTSTRELGAVDEFSRLKTGSDEKWSSPKSITNGTGMSENKCIFLLASSETSA
jgi:hypothetical protein